MHSSASLKKYNEIFFELYKLHSMFVKECKVQDWFKFDMLVFDKTTL